MLHILGDPGALADADGVAVVGARRASSYGLDVARGWAAACRRRESPWSPGSRSASTRRRTPARSRRPGGTIGVLAASAHVAVPGARLPPARRGRRSAARSSPRCRPARARYRWCFVARNRIIAALAAATVVVQATERSGSLTTADFAAELGRAVGAVPGPVTSRLSGGTHALIQTGAPLIRDAADALDLLAGATGRVFAAPAAAPPPDLAPPLASLLDAIEDGTGTLGELAETPDEARAALAGLGELERLGLVRRGFAGRWERAA